MDNLEELATQGTQDEEKQNKNTTQYALDTTQVLVNRPDVHIYNSFVVRKYYKHKSTELDCKEHLQVHVLQIQMSLQRMFHVEGIARSY